MCKLWTYSAPSIIHCLLATLTLPVWSPNVPPLSSRVKVGSGFGFLTCTNSWEQSCLPFPLQFLGSQKLACSVVLWTEEWHRDSAKEGHARLKSCTSVPSAFLRLEGRVKVGIVCWDHSQQWEWARTGSGSSPSLLSCPCGVKAFGCVCAALLGSTMGGF